MTFLPVEDFPFPVSVPLMAFPETALFVAGFLGEIILRQRTETKRYLIKESLNLEAQAIK